MHAIFEAGGRRRNKFSKGRLTDRYCNVGRHLPKEPYSLVLIHLPLEVVGSECRGCRRGEGDIHYLIRPRGKPIQPHTVATPYLVQRWILGCIIELSSSPGGGSSV